VQDPPVIGRVPAAEKMRPVPSRLKLLLDNRWAVLAAIFFAMMFLGLPLLWRCPSFSKIEKLVWTLIVLIYSAVLLWVFYLVMAWCFGRISESVAF